MLKCSVNAISHKLKDNTVVFVSEKQDDKLFCDIYYLHHAYYWSGKKAERKVIQAVYQKNRHPMYMTEGGNYRPGTKFIDFIRDREIAFVNKECMKTVTDFFGSDPREAILSLERNLIEEKQRKKEEKEKKAFDNMTSLFSKPAWPEEEIFKRGEGLIAKYAIRTGENTYYFTCCRKEETAEFGHRETGNCPFCGSKVTALHPNRMLKHKIVSDDLWVYLPRMGFGSYFNFVQTVNVDTLQITQRLTERARYIEKGKTREYWTAWSDGTWAKGKSSYFVRFLYGHYYVESPSWCENSYVIPEQYIAFLHSAIPGTKKIPLEKFFVGDLPYFWYEEQGFLKDNLTESAIRRIRQLVKNGLYGVADYYSVIDANFRMKNFNTGKGRLNEFLKLTKASYEDLLALPEKTCETVKKVREPIVPEPKEIKLINQEAYVQDAISLVKNGRAKGTFRYLFPVFENSRIKAIQIQVTVSGSKKKPVVNVDTSLLGIDGYTYQKIGNHWHKASFKSSDGSEIVTETDFNTFMKRPHMKEIVRPELVNEAGKAAFVTSTSLCSRNGMLLVEKLYHAGFAKLADEIILTANGGYEKMISEMITNARDDKLYRVLGIPRMIYSKAFPKKSEERSGLNLDKLNTMRIIVKNNPGITYEEVNRMIALKKQISSGESLLVNGQKYSETLSYLEAHKKVYYHEYTHYIENIRALNLKVSRKRAFPEDFEEAQCRIHDILHAQKEIKNAGAMKKLHDALTSQAPFIDFMKQNTKYLVFVPESPQELVREGERLHNCLRTYVDRVSEGNTSIFFIREAYKPDAAFVAMEYRDGKIIQIHSSCNKGVDEDVRSFAEGFIKVLKGIRYEPREWLEQKAA